VPQRVTSPEFIGRAPELAALLNALDTAADGRFSAVFVAGESGVGKSRLLRELDRSAEAQGAHVLAGDCVRLTEGELPFAPIRSALRRLERERRPGDVDLDRLLAQLGATGGATPDSEPARDPLAQARMFDLLLDVLTAFAEQAPVVLVVEDVHWADRSTLDLLAYLLANARHERLLLICTYRSDELNRSHPLRAFLAEHSRPPAVRRIDLQPFTPQELAAQIHGILGSDPKNTHRVWLQERLR
jgi:predicted ATPase